MSLLRRKYSLQFEDRAIFRGCYLKRKKLGTALYVLKLTEGLYSFLTPINNGFLTFKKSKTKTNVDHIDKIFDHIRVDLTLKASPENGKIPKLEKQEFIGQQRIACI